MVRSVVKCPWATSANDVAADGTGKFYIAYDGGVAIAESQRSNQQGFKCSKFYDSAAPARRIKVLQNFVYVTFEDHTVRKFDFEGNVVWQEAADFHVLEVAGNNLVYMTGETFYMVDVNNAVLDTYPTRLKPVHSSYDDMLDTLYIVDGRGKVQSIMVGDTMRGLHTFQGASDSVWLVATATGVHQVTEPSWWNGTEVKAGYGAVDDFGVLEVIRGKVDFQGNDLGYLLYYSKRSAQLHLVIGMSFVNDSTGEVEYSDTIRYTRNSLPSTPSNPQFYEAMGVALSVGIQKLIAGLVTKEIDE